MAKNIMVVYDFYDIVQGHPQKVIKAELVAFCKENLEYDDMFTYAENMQRFVLDCIENQVVYIDHGIYDGGVYIPVHNIHGFYPCNNNLLALKKCNTADDKSNGQQNQQNQKNNLDNRRFNKHRKIKHNHDQNQKLPSSTTLPFEVEKTDSHSDLIKADKPFGTNGNGYSQ